MTLDRVAMILATFAVDREPAASSTRADADDIARVLDGDGEAYARIVRRYQPLLVRRMARFSRNTGEVETLVHDAFVEAYLSLPRYRAAAPFEHWLQRIATRVGYRFWKRRARNASTLDASVPSPRADDVVERDDEIAQLRSGLGRLPPRDRLVLTLLYLDGHSVAEAAMRSGWSQTMVKVQAFRARKRLKASLDEGLGS